MREVARFLWPKTRGETQADEHEVRVRLTVRLYGRAVAVRLFGAVPDDAV